MASMAVRHERILRSVVCSDDVHIKRQSGSSRPIPVLRIPLGEAKEAPFLRVPSYAIEEREFLADE